MKLIFSVDQHSLSTILSIMQPICNKKTSLDATANIYFLVGDNNEIIIRSTDLEASLQFILPITLVSSDFISFSVNEKRLFDFIQGLDCFIQFSFDGSTLFLNHGSQMEIDPDFNLSLLTADPASFPAFPEKIENVSAIDSNFIKFAFEKISTISTSSTSSNISNGFLLELDPSGTTLVSTNGHSLIFCKNTNFSLSEYRSFVIPRKSISELRRVLALFDKDPKSLLSLFLGICKGQVVFSGPNFNFFTRLVVDPFPDYKPLLNFQHYSKGRIPLASLQPVLRRVGFLLNGKFLPATFSFLDTRIKISFNNPESGSISESISYHPLSPFNLSIKFYSPYLLAAASLFEEADVDFFLGQGPEPIVITHDFPLATLIYLTMPVIN